MWHSKNYMLLLFMLIFMAGEKIHVVDKYKKYQREYQKELDQLLKEYTPSRDEKLIPKINKMRNKILDITDTRNIVLDNESIAKLNTIMPKDHLLEDGMTIGDAITFIIKSELAPDIKDNFIKNFSKLPSEDTIGKFPIPYGERFSSNSIRRTISQLFDIIQEKIDDDRAEQEAKDLKKAQKDIKKARSHREQQIEKFLTEPLDKPGQIEYNLKFYHRSNVKINPGKTTVQELLHHIASTQNHQYDAGETIFNNMSVHLPNAIRRDIYFGGKKPIITEDVINHRLAQIRKEYEAAPAEAVARMR